MSLRFNFGQGYVEIKELGDVLLHIVFYAKMGSESNDFDIADVCNSICDKLIDRHPHIYGDVKVKDRRRKKELGTAEIEGRK